MASGKGEPDFFAGHTCCLDGKFSWFQRITGSCGLLLVLGGEGEIGYRDSRLVAGRGSLVLLNPRIRHRFCPLGFWELLWFHFVPRAHVVHALEWGDPVSGAGQLLLDGADFERVRTALEEVFDLDSRRPPGWNSLALLLLESVVVRAWNRCLQQRAGRGANWVAQAQKLLTGTDEEMDRIAMRCGVSRSTLYSKFKAATGVSPRQYREMAALRRAAGMLETMDLSVAEIAELAGMPDPYYFSTRFRKFTGVSPREYRKRRNAAG